MSERSERIYSYFFFNGNKPWQGFHRPSSYLGITKRKFRLCLCDHDGDKTPGSILTNVRKISAEFFNYWQNRWNRFEMEAEIWHEVQNRIICVEHIIILKNQFNQTKADKSQIKLHEYIFAYIPKGTRRADNWRTFTYW